MAYEANRGPSGTSGNSIQNDRELQKERNVQNNAKNIRNAADVAIASKNPYAMAAGGAVKLADKVSGGKASESLGKAMNTANKISPGGRQIQNASNRLSESGASDKIGQAASIKNRVSGTDANAAVAGGNQGGANGAASTSNNQNVGGGQSSSLPSSSDGMGSSFPRLGGLGLPSLLNRRKKDDDDSSSEEEETKTSGVGSFLARRAIITIVLTVAPFLLLLLLFIMVIALLSGLFNDYQDAFGMGSTLGQETGGVTFTATSKEQEEFLNRVNDVKLNYQMQGKTLDAMAMVGVFHSLQSNGVDIHYEDVTTSVIQEWADASFEGNTYSEEVFRNNLINTIFPKYKPNEEKSFYEQMADEVFDYLDRYYDLIGQGGSSSAISTGEFSTWKQGDSAWGKTPMGTSGKTLSQIGCLVTSVSMLIAKSGVQVSISPFNPGTFVEFLNKNGGINSGGNFMWGAATKAAPDFKYQGQVSVSGMSRQEKFNKIKSIVSQNGVYAVAEVKGNTGQHWVAIDGISGDTINMMDPSSSSTDMWSQYNWANTSTIAYYKVG